MEEKPALPRKSPNESEPDKSDLQEAHDTLKKLETQSGGSTKVKIDADENRKRHIDTEEEYAQKIHTGHASSVLFVCAIFVLSIIGLLFMSPMVLLVNNKEQLVNDLNDGFYAYQKYTNKVLGMQLGGNCSEESIECKFKTMSPMLKKRFERYGFTVAANEVKKTKRYNVSSVVFPDGMGAAANASTLSSARKNARADSLLEKVYSSRTGVYQDQKFYERLLNQFGIEQKDNVSGDTLKEYDQAFDDRVAQGDSGRFKETANVDQAADGSQSSDDLTEGDDYLDANGRGVYSLSTLSDLSPRYTSEIYTNLVDKANTHLALACAFATYGHLVENSFRKAKTTTIARFAMNYLSLADDIKSDTVEVGRGSEIAVESLANKLTKPGKNNKSAMDADSYRMPALGEQAQDMSSMIEQLTPVQALFTMIKPGGPSAPGSEYLKGALNIPLSNAKNKTPQGLCAEGMASAQMSTEQGGRCYTPASMPLASYIGTVAAGIVGPMQDPIERFICPGSVKAVVDIVKNASRAEVTTTLPIRLKIASDQESKKFTSSLTGSDAQNVIFAGTGILLGDRAQSLGMRPANAATLMMYLKMSEVARQEQETQERQIARQTPWDATNPYSFLGSVVSKISPAGQTMPGGSLRSNANSLLALLPASLSTIAWTGASALYTQPMHFDVSRLRPASLCGIEGLDAQIMPDMGCNIRYSMSIEELNADLKSVIDYMTKAHPENAKESLNEIQGRDTGADTKMGTKMKEQAEKGSKATYVDKKTGKPNDYTEYAKFMEYCVNRSDPWGGLGTVVLPKEKTAEETADEKKEQEEEAESAQSTISSSRLYADEAPDEKNVAEGYYALGWGAKSDQDWYTGKRCVDDDGKYKEMLKNFRAYTMACSILADLSGSVECWDKDKDLAAHDDFYATNDVIFQAGGS